MSAAVHQPSSSTSSTMSTKESMSAASYDQGMEIQPNSSWKAGDNKNSHNSNKKNSEHLKSSKTAQQLEKNIIPDDKEDPHRETKALPFATASSKEVQEHVRSNVMLQDREKTDEFHNTNNNNNDDEMTKEEQHNGNILDRTMDQLRSWIHSTVPSASSSSSESQSSSSSSPTAEATGTTITTTSEHNDIGSIREVASSTASSAVSKLSTLTSTAAQSASHYKDAALSSVSHLTDEVSTKLSGVTHNVNDVVNVVKDKSSSVLHNVGDRASATIATMKHQVNDFVSHHQKNPNEPLTTTLTNNFVEYLPSQEALQSTAQRIIPPLAQQASSSSEFFLSFFKRYVATGRDFMVALQQQSYPLQFMTALLFVTHMILPLFFFDKGAARSVMYCYILSSLLSHATFFLSGHLRYMFLAHLLFVPMVISLTLHAGFSEAGDVAKVEAAIDNGDSFAAAAAASISIRSFLFVLWLRTVLMTQASLLTLDAVNLLDLLGLSLTTPRGQEMGIIKKKVKLMRKQLADTIEPSSQLSSSNESSSSSSSSLSSSSSTSASSSRWEGKQDNTESSSLSSAASQVASSLSGSVKPNSSTNIPGVSSANSASISSSLPSLSSSSEDSGITIQSSEETSSGETSRLRRRPVA